MRRIIPALAFLAALLLPIKSPAQDLIVSAAASLTDAFSDIEPAFEKLHPGVDVVMNFAGSGTLYRQIERGAPVDVFASANPRWMNRTVTEGFARADEVVLFAQNSLVLAVPMANPAQVEGVADLATTRVATIGIGSPATVPAGHYAKGALDEAGLYDQLESKMIFAENVRQVLDYLARGEVDCGFVYRTDVIRTGNKVAVVEEVGLHTPVKYPIARLAHSANPDLARSFVEFVTGKTGLALLESRGFKRP